MDMRPRPEALGFLDRIRPRRVGNFVLALVGGGAGFQLGAMVGGAAFEGSPPGILVTGAVAGVLLFRKIRSL